MGFVLTAVLCDGIIHGGFRFHFSEVRAMTNATFESAGSVRAYFCALLILVALLPGCNRSSAYPRTPKVRVEGIAGTDMGFSVTYFDGKDTMSGSGSGKKIPESGVYIEDLNTGHQGLLVQAIPSGTATITVILLDDTKEIQRSTAHGNNETAQVMAGKVSLGPPPKLK
jgi:hypothetical protein